MNLQDIEFSVLLPILDREDIVRGFPIAVESLFNNTLKPSEVVVVIDGPVSDKFKKLILDYSNKYGLFLIWTKKKIGLDNALNLGLKKCNSKYIFRADGDDINRKDRFELQLPYLLNGYDVVGSNIDEYDEAGNYISSRKVPLNDDEINKIISLRNPINHMSVGYLKKSVLEVGGYPELFLKEDYGLWIKLKAESKKFKNIDKSLVKATTGKRMIIDRGGLRYVYSEFLLQRFLLKYKLTNLLKSFIIFLLRSTVFMLPPLLRTYIYKSFLRKNK